MRHGIERIVGKSDVVHPRDHRMRRAEIPRPCERFPRGVPRAAPCVSIPCKNRKPLNGESVAPSVPLANGPAARHKCRVPEMIDIDHAVIGNLRFVEHVEAFSGYSRHGNLPPSTIIPPIASAVPADEFRHGVHEQHRRHIQWAATESAWRPCCRPPAARHACAPPAPAPQYRPHSPLGCPRSRNRLRGYFRRSASRHPPGDRVAAKRVVIPRFGKMCASSV